MSLFAISDLHLSLGGEKPMDIFGARWENHHIKLQENWHRVVGPEDTVILGGDLSWALKLEEAAADLAFLHGLPGRKIIFRGNHDYWWKSYAKVRQALPPSVEAVQNNYRTYGDIAVCGTRGWTAPGGENYTEQDGKIFQRELLRLQMSLEAAQKDGYTRLLVTLHYPPWNARLEDTEIVAVMQRFGVQMCLYGHLHGADHHRAFQGEREGIQYYFTAADFLDFTPVQLDLDVFS